LKTKLVFITCVIIDEFIDKLPEDDKGKRL